MIDLRKLYQLSRPRQWLYTAVPFVIGFVAGLPNGYHQPYPAIFWLLLAYFLIPANIFLYGLGNLFDKAVEKSNGEQNQPEQKVAGLQPDERRSMFVILAFIVVITMLLLPLIPQKWQPLMWLFLFFATFYNAPPLRYKARPIFDSYANLLYVIPGFLGYAITTGTLPPSPIIMAAICLAAGMYAFYAISSLEADKEFGLTTIAVNLGKPRTLLFTAINWAFFAALSIAAIGLPAVVTLLYPVIPLVVYFRPTVDMKRLNWLVFGLNVIVAVLIIGYKLLSVV
jgi:lycopene elongase/hydratase (dihydrobisanhydrobacterioruberin-forming)